MGLRDKKEVRKGGLILKNNKSTTRHGNYSERRVAKALGMRTTPGSGALDGAKSDAYSREFRMESKSTIHESIALKRSWLTKIHNEARSTGREPALSISFVYPDGSEKNYGDWVLIPRSTFEDLKG